MSWKDTIRKDAGPSSSWKSTIRAEIPEESSGLASSAEALARGGAQGLTFGFADEMTGAAEALKDVAMTDKGLGDILDLYTQHRDESRANYKSSEEEHPWLSTAGNVAGSIIPALATGGATAGLKGAISTGLWSGGLTGAGMSEAEDLGGIATDAAIGAGVGGAMGSALHGIGAAAGSDYGKKLLDAGKSIAKFPLELDPVDHFIKSVQLGNKGRKIVGKAAEKALKEDSRILAKDMTGTLADELSTAAQKQSEIIKSAPKIPVKAYVDDLLNNLDNLDDKFGHNEKAAKELSDLRDDVVNHLVERRKTINVPLMEKLDTDDAAVRKLLDRADELNSKAEIEKQLAQEASTSGERTFTSSNVKNSFQPDEQLSILEKNGKPVKVSAIRETETGVAGMQDNAADMLETAQQEFNRKFIEAKLPFEARVFNTLEGGPVMQIIDNSTTPPTVVSKGVQLDKLKDIPEFPYKDIKPGKSTLKIPRTEGPEMLMDPMDLMEWKRHVGSYGSAGDNTYNTKAARSFANRAVSKADRPLTDVEKAMGMSPDADRATELLRKNAPGLEEIDARISGLKTAEDMVPSMGEVLAAEGNGATSSTAWAKTQDFIDALPKDVSDKLSPRMTELAQARILRGKITNEGLDKSPIGHLIAGTAKGAYYGAGNLIGLANHHFTPQWAKSTASALATGTSKASQKLSTILTNFAEKDQQGRNALMFAIQQNPEYRELLKQFEPK